MTLSATAIRTEGWKLASLRTSVLFIGLMLLPAFAQPARAQTGLQFTAAKNTGLSELLNKRRETLQQRIGQPLTGHQWWLWGLGSFDYDRDGDVDLMVCIHGSTGGVILRNELKETGRLTFTDATEELGVDGFIPSTDNYPLIWDFDGDGFLDIAGLLDDRQTPCLLNQGGKRFTKAQFSLHPINYPDEIRDLNGDGYVDIAQTLRDKQVRFHYDPAAKSFEKIESPSEWPADLPMALRRELEQTRDKEGNRFVKFKFFRRDLNGDGWEDLIVRAFGSYSGERLGWYLLASESEGFQQATEQLGLPHEGAPFLVEDVDHDGDVDLLIASGEEAGLFLNDGQGKFSRREGPLTDFVRQRCPYLHVAMRADFDYDGDLDLAVSNRRYGREIVFENRGNGDFATALSVRGWDADPLVLRDINNDGLVDVIVGGSDGKESIGVYLNTTEKVGNYRQLYVRLPSPNVYGIGTRVEVFPAGTLGKAGAIPVVTADAATDGAPLPVGLGDASAFDLNVTFPDGKKLEKRNVKAEQALFITLAGISATKPE